MEEEPAHRVTVSALYNQGEEQKKELREINQKLAILLERDKRDYERIGKLEKDLAVVTKWVYFAALPLLLVVSVVLGIDKIPMI